MNCKVLFRDIVAVIVFAVLATIKALPLSSIVDQALSQARMEKVQMETFLQTEHHLQKRAATKLQCVVPTNLADMFQKINSNLTNVNFAQTAKDGKAIVLTSSDQAKFIGQADPNESKTCPNTITTDKYAPLNHRSMCPYYFDILQLPEGYYPQTLYWAVCKCQSCIQNNVYGCETVKTRVNVLKPAGCFQGMQKYEELLLDVPTSCTCAFRGTVQTSNDIAGLGIPVETTTAVPTTTTTPWGVS